MKSLTKLFSLIFFSVLISLTFKVELYAQLKFQIYEINVPGIPNAKIMAINDSGAVAGVSDSSIFIYDSGKVTIVPSFHNWPMSDLQGLYLNNIDELGGSFMDPLYTSVEEGFLYENGKMKGIGDLGLHITEVTGINNSGVVCGYSNIALSQIEYSTHAVIYQNSILKDLGYLNKEDLGSNAYDINNNNWVVGTSGVMVYNNHVETDSSAAERAFIYKNGTMINLGTLNGIEDADSWANAINDLGYIVGGSEQWYNTNNNISHSIPILWDPSGSLYQLPVIKGAENYDATASGINNNNIIIGGCALSNSYIYKTPVIWIDGQVYNINDLIVNNSGYTIIKLDKINNRNEIIAEASHSGKYEYVILRQPGQTKFTVNTTEDKDDADLNDGNCDCGGQKINGKPPCSLRAAIQQANYNKDRDTVVFDINSTDIPKIIPSSQLPDINVPLVIDGTTEPKFNRIELNGNGKIADGLILQGGKSLIQGMVIDNFSGLQVYIEKNGQDTLRDNYIGVGSNGNGSFGGGGGIQIIKSSGNMIGGENSEDRNIISGSIQGSGIEIFGDSSRHNKIQGNFIGMNNDGSEAIPNEYGINIIDADSNLIGGSTGSIGQAPGNLISGNSMGIRLFSDSLKHPGTYQNKIIGNMIGPAYSGTDSVKNSYQNGIVAFGFVKDNYIGDGNTNDGNLISGNRTGILLDGILCTENYIFGNYVGTDIQGFRSLSNNFGIVVDNSPGNIIGSKNKSGQNIVSANINSNITIQGKDAKENKLSGNLIGPFKGGLAAPTKIHPNGVLITLGASKNLIGGSTYGEDNLISGNGQGVRIEGGYDNSVLGNLIGTDIEGNAALGNGQGILILFSQNNNIGGSYSGDRNIISGNGNGINISNDPHPVLVLKVDTVTLNKAIIDLDINNTTYTLGADQVKPSSGNIIKGNYIGTNIDGTKSIANLNEGIELLMGVGKNIIGGPLTGEGNLISGNKQVGILISTLLENDPTEYPSPFDNIIQGNIIGLASDGITPLSDTVGIIVFQGKNNLIGGGTKKAGNIIDNNYLYGIYLDEGTGQKVELNEIKNNKTGIQIDRAAQANIIGNIIWYNETGIKGDRSNIKLLGNSIKDNTGTSTGINLDSSSAVIQGNLIENNSGNGIKTQNQSALVVRGNNIINNDGYGINNLSPLIPVDAEGNWWGDKSGPGGTGSGSGNSVSGGVNFSNWLQNTYGLFITTGFDTLYLAANVTDTIGAFVQNWKYPNDEVNMSVSDSLGLTNENNSLTLAENADGIPVVINSTSGGINKIYLKAVSKTNSDSAFYSFYVNSYQSALTGIKLYPDTAKIAAGDSVYFHYSAEDQHGGNEEITPDWSATGGTINSNGLFIAGTVNGNFAVSVTDKNTGLKNSAVVIIGEITTVDNKKSILPKEYNLSQNFPNPFNPTTTVKFALPKTSNTTFKVYNVLGQLVSTILDERLKAGNYSVRIDASLWASGVYFYMLKSGSFVQTKKMILLK